MGLFVLGENWFHLEKDLFKLGEGWRKMGEIVVQFWRSLSDLVSDDGLSRGGMDRTCERDGSN